MGMWAWGISGFRRRHEQREQLRESLHASGNQEALDSLVAGDKLAADYAAENGPQFCIGKLKRKPEALNKN